MRKMIQILWGAGCVGLLLPSKLTAQNYLPIVKENAECDLLRGFKIVSNAYCIRYTTMDEGTSHYVRIDNKDFLLIGYNREYFYCFSDKSELYELHFSPLSDVILQVKKIRE